MKQLIQLNYLCALLACGNAFATDPVQGFYLGVLAGVTHAPNTQINFTIDDVAYSGAITLQPVGVDGGFSLGYRVQQFRVEGELLLGYNSYNEFKTGSCTLISPSVVGPQGTCPTFVEEQGLGFKGNTTGMYGLVNFFYDFVPTNPNANSMVPFVGLGIGMGIIKNSGQIQNNQYFDNGYTPVIITASQSKSSIAGQGMFGINYYIDDFTTIGIDYRYLSTFSSNSNSATTSNSVSKQFAINTINFTANFALEKG